MLDNNDSKRRSSQLISEINEFYIEELGKLKVKNSHLIASIKAAWKTELSTAI